MRAIDADRLRRSLYHEAFEMDSDMQRWDSGCWIRYKMFENAIDAAPTIDVPQWIPCAERLPDEDLWTGKRQCSDSVLMTVYCAEDEERITDYGHTVDGRWYSETIQKYVPDCWEVVAWCERPEPWKGEG